MTISMNRRTLAKVGTLGALSAFFGTTVQAQVKKHNLQIGMKKPTLSWLVPDLQA